MTRIDLSQNFKLYFFSHGESSYMVDSFTTKDEALAYIERDLKSRMLVDDEHRCSDNIYWSASIAQYEIYDGSPETLDEDGELVDMADPIYVSPSFYVD